MVDLARMKAHCNAGLLAGLAAFLVLCPVALWTASGQAPAPVPAAPQQHTSSLGFSYSVPGDWEVVDSQGKMPQLKEQADKNADSDEEKKGLACVQVVLPARHGEPAWVMVEVALPFDCFGEAMTEGELPGFASGASQGLKQSFDVGEPVTGNYSLGGHTMWIERTGYAQGPSGNFLHRRDHVRTAQEGRCLLDGDGRRRYGPAYLRARRCHPRWRIPGRPGPSDRLRQKAVVRRHSAATRSNSSTLGAASRTFTRAVVRRNTATRIATMPMNSSAAGRSCSRTIPSRTATTGLT